jgi:hypothetical protein
MRSSALHRRPRVVDVVDRLRSVCGRADRRSLASAVLLVLIVVTAMSALVASAVEPRAKGAAATVRHQRPNYLLPFGVLIRDGYLSGPALTGDRGRVGVPARAPAPPTAPDPRAAMHQDPLIAQYQGPPGTLSPAAIATLALEHGCGSEAAITATAIALAESGGSPSAQGDTGLMTSVWDWSAGLWQIRGLRAERGTGGLRDSVANQDVNSNAAAMTVISSGCTDWTPWSTYNSGAYLQFTTVAGQAVGYVVRYFETHGHRYPPVPAPDPSAAIPAQGAGGETSGQRAAAGTRTSTAPRPGRTATHPAGSPAPSQAGAGSTQTSAPAAAPSSTSPAASQLPLPIPTLPLPTTTLPLPLPSTTLPLPLPTLPGLP